MKKIKGFYYYVLFILLFNYQQKAATCTALANGDWAVAATWSCGQVPTCGDSIVIPAGITVTITSQQNKSACGAAMKLTIYGTLKFNAGSKLQMPCGSAVYVMQGGSIQAGNGGGNSNYIEICNVTLWKASDGPLSGPTCLPANGPNCSAVLPVELISFTATSCMSDKVCLNWVTATEKNNSYFDVERSLNASDFQTLFYVNSKSTNGTSTSALNYEEVDEKALSGISYYRLKQVDKDMTFRYSSIISVNNVVEKNIRFIVYPNPNLGEFSADISGLENNHEIKIILHDLQGISLFEGSYFTNESGSTFKIVPKTKLKAGTYICSLYLEEIEYQVKVLITEG